MSRKSWGYNPLYLSRAFKALVGVSPKRYHTKAKIDLVMAMVKKDRRLLLKEAASIIHFDDELYLAKVFRKETGHELFGVQAKTGRGRVIAEMEEGHAGHEPNGS